MAKPDGSGASANLRRSFVPLSFSRALLFESLILDRAAQEDSHFVKLYRRYVYRVKTRGMVDEWSRGVFGITCEIVFLFFELTSFGMS